MEKSIRTEYFEGSLNYSLANEDSGFEYNMIQKEEAIVGALASSGARLIPILAKSPKKIVMFDISEPQIEFSKFRLAAIKSLDYEEYLRLYGLDDFNGLNALSDRPLVSENVFPILGKISCEGDLKEKIISVLGRESCALAYTGKWEKTFYKISKLILKIVGRNNIDALSKTKSLSEQTDLINRFMFKLRLNLAFLFLGNANLFKSLLYKGDFPEKNDSRSFFRFYKDIFMKLLGRYHINENYFLNIVFYGKVTSKTSLPFEYGKDLFEKAKSALENTEVEFKQGNLLVEIPGQDEKFDYLFLSDVPSYFSGETEESYIQTLRPAMKVGGLLVPRYYLKTCMSNLDGFIDVSSEYAEIIEREETAVYNIKIYKKLEAEK